MPLEPEFAYVHGLPGYACTKGGRVFSCRGGKTRPRDWHPIKPAMGTGRLEGWWAVTVYVGARGDCKPRRLALAEVIALAWLGPKPDGHCVAFRDRDKSNLHADNLCWVPIPEAMGHYKLFGEAHPVAKLKAVQVTAMRREVADAVARGEKPDFDAIGARYDCTGMNVRVIAKRTSWAHLEDGVPAWVPPPRNRFTSGKCKLSEPDVVRIKQRLKRGETPRQIHPDYADLVGLPAIEFIARGRTWNHVKV